jgi:4-methylaminobutanoate oxidase (formaldehyde-forming)
LKFLSAESRALLQSLSPDDFSHAGFPFATARWISIGFSSVLALRLTYVGELGWKSKLRALSR